MSSQSRLSLKNPPQTLCEAMLVMVEAQQNGESATLTLRQGSALLTHLRHALAIALAPTPEEMRSHDRWLLTESLSALQHVRNCGACGEDSLESCSSGGQRAARTIAAIELALTLPASMDSVRLSTDQPVVTTREESSSVASQPPDGARGEP